MRAMGRKIWTAEALERMTPAEQDSIFASSVATDLDGVPAEFLGRVRARAQERIAGANDRQ